MKTKLYIQKCVSAKVCNQCVGAEGVDRRMAEKEERDLDSSFYLDILWARVSLSYSVPIVSYSLSLKQ